MESILNLNLTMKMSIDWKGKNVTNNVHNKALINWLIAIWVKVVTTFGGLLFQIFSIYIGIK